MKILIIGNGGSGKSTLVAKLGTELNLPVTRDELESKIGVLIRTLKAEIC